MADLKSTKLLNYIQAFRERSLSGDPFSPEEFEEVDARRARYAILWSFYENTAYRDIHRWASKFRADMGLYKYIRNIYNPANRLGIFWQTHLYGGRLDMRITGNVDSAIPIEEINSGKLDLIRPALQNLWRWSNWGSKKDLYTLYGTVFGDVGIKIVDDTEKSRVYFEVLHPSSIKEVDRDAHGFVKAYHLEEVRLNENGKKVVFEEIVTRGKGDEVNYSTLKDGKFYAWNGIASQWKANYGYVPFLATQHIDVGMNWGWSEFHAARPFIQEVDDLASLLHDHIRKMVNPVWLFSGVRKPSSNQVYSETTASTARPEQLREEIPALFGSEGAKADPLIANMDIRAVSEAIDRVLQHVVDSFPELKMDLFDAPGEISGRALRLKRQPVETKGEIRQATYNADMVRAQQMAMTIGGIRGYEGYEGIDIGSFDRGDIDHRIIQKRMFSTDPLDDLELEREFWLVAKMAGASGIPIDTFLETQDFIPNERVEEIRNHQAYKDLREQEEEMFEFNLELPNVTGDQSAENELRNT